MRRVAIDEDGTRRVAAVPRERARCAASVASVVLNEGADVELDGRRARSSAPARRATSSAVAAAVAAARVVVGGAETVAAASRASISATEGGGGRDGGGRRRRPAAGLEPSTDIGTPISGCGRRAPSRGC